jgi:hypothetical protein
MQILQNMLYLKECCVTYMKYKNIPLILIDALRETEHLIILWFVIEQTLSVTKVCF